MSDPADPAPVELVAVSPAVVAEMARPAPAGPLVLSPASTEAIVAAAVASTPPKVPATPAQEAQTEVATAGQRRVNLIWEFTQSGIALMVATATMYVSVKLAIRVESKEAATAIILLSNAFFLVSGFYFGRTNHQKTGGVGEKDGGR